MSADDEPAEAEKRARYGVPPMPPVVLLAVVGVLCGFVMVALVWLSGKGCERVRDTTNCGAIGLPLLVLTVAVAIVLGAIALKRLAIENPALIAFLGVLFLCVVVVGLLADRLYSTWTLLVVPGLAAVTFVLAHLLARALNRADA
ncbi:hypothetical protein [Kribbella deserti]|uniref:Uncharacterized protein n=1 Tax=Kribbella deserti TaxID=1926257 RepID=A0ABV6QHW0_9ACTN